MRKKIALTMGDAGGIGPEVVLKSLMLKDIREACAPVVIGRRDVMEEAIRLLGAPLRLNVVGSPSSLTSKKGEVALIEIGGKEKIPRRRPSAAAGNASYLSIKKATELALSGEVDAIVTAPISKESLKLAGLKWPGHTEMLAELTSKKDYAMALVGGGLRVVLATIHTSIRSVPPLIKKERVLKTIKMAMLACRMLGIDRPRIAVSGLNPHAGEAGIFGDEEEKEISPAVREAKKAGIRASGPYPPDTVFLRALKGEFDMVVCMYHDQGLIPLKLLGFKDGVNFTVGLPIIRTSPDHGTAFDIAWKGIADPSSMAEAVRLAGRMKLPLK